MKYAIVTDGATELKWDSSIDMPDGAIALTDEQHAQLLAGLYIIKDGSIVANPEPLRFPVAP